MFYFYQNYFNCDHHRGIQLLYDDQERDHCQLVAYKCNNFSQFLSGNCVKCGSDGQSCHLIGYRSGPLTLKQGNYYVLTGERAPYCGILYMNVATFQI